VEPPSIFGEPSNLNCCVGSPVAFNCAAAGDNPLLYQWQHAGTNVASATNSSLTLPAVQMSDAGAYSCLVSNLTGIAMSSAAMLTVNPATPSVTWANPAALGYGSMLTYSQLSAMASVPGTFSYSPPTGTVLTVGTQTLSVVFTPTDNVNYSAVTNKVSMVVSPAPLTVTAVNRSKTYGQSVTFSGSEFTATGLVNGDTVAGVALASAGSGATAVVSVSPYTIVPSAAVGTGLGNYSILYVNGALTVSPATLAITANNRTKSYGQSLTFSGNEFTASGLVNADAVSSVSLTSSGASAVASLAGSPYNIVASAAVGTGLGNYTITYASGTLSLSPATLTITANNRTKTYGQITTFAGTEFTVIGLANGDAVSSVSLTSLGAFATESLAGSPYNIVASAAVGTGLGNYTIAYASGTLSLSPATLTVTANNRTKTYGQAVTFAETEFAASGLLNGDTVSDVSLTSAGSATTATVADSPYTIVPSAAIGTGLGNYTIAYASGTLSLNPAALTITGNNRTKTYGQSMTFAGTEFTVSGLANGDAVSSVSLTSPGAFAAASLAGSPYNIVASAAVGTGLGNYTIAYASGTLSLSPATLTITANNRTKTYGQSATFAGTEFTATGLLNGDTVSSLILTSAGSPATASVASLPYSIIPGAAVGSGLGNYTIAYANGALTVSPAALIVTANNRTKTYGQTVAFAGTEFTAIGLLNGDTATSIVLSSPGSSATANVTGSPYAIVPGGMSGTGLGNYSIVYSSGLLTITPASLTITAQSRSKTYGQTVAFAGTEFTTFGLVNSDSVNSVTLSCAGSVATAGVAGSPFAIVANSPVGVGLSNYAINFANGTLAVSPAALTITANNRSKTYGQTVAFAGNEFTASGLLNNDTVNSITLSSAGVAATATVAGSPYSIVPSAAVGAGLANYAFTYADGVLTVTVAAPTVIWPSPAPIIYGTPLTGTQLDASPSEPGTFTYTPTNGTVLNVGVHTLSVVFTPSDDSDYGIATNVTSLMVLPAALKIVATSASRIYGQANPALGGTITGVTNGDNITVSYSTTATTNSSLGNYDIVPSLIDPNGRETNYAVSLVNGTLTITRAAPIVTWINPAPIIYGTALSGTQLSASASVPGSFSYIPAIGTALSTGTNWLSVTFTPIDSTDYGGVNGSVPVVVLPASLIVTASSVTRPFATANPTFAGSITGLTNGDDISASYSSTATFASTVGTFPIVPSLIDPNNRQTNYTVTMVNGILVVGHPAQIFTWTNPAPMTYGAPLTLNQLNASANIPGSYAYTPSNGTTLNTGTNTLSVVFTPEDPVDYSPITNAVAVVVVPAPLTVTAPTFERVYGQPNPAFIGLLTGVTNNDVVTETYNCSASSTSAVATYSIVPSALFGQVLTNYTITYVNGLLTVDPAPLTITANNNAKTYGQVVAFTRSELTTSGLVNGDTVTGVTLNTLGAVASATVTGSPYSIVPSEAIGFGLSNYNITYSKKGLLTVNPAALNISANNLSKIYGQTLVFAGTEFVATGLVNGDSVTTITLTSPGSVATASVLGSPYGIVPGAAIGTGLSNYIINYADGLLTVGSALPVVSWSEPAAITYGAPLSSNQLNATANAEGAFSYLPTNGSVLNSGTNNLSVIFTPVDAADYATVTNNVSLLVSQVPLTIMGSNASRVYGQENPQFIGAITGLTNGDNITADYGCNATNTSSVGAYLIVPRLADPQDRQTNYTVTVIEGALIISQATPDVSWNNPASTLYGAPLDASQLNAIANVPGSFTYAPPLGTVLNSGTNMLYVFFAPEDATNYASATNSVSIVVTAPQAVQTTQTTLQSSVQNGLLVVSWSTNAPNATLEMTTDLLAEWVPVNNSVVDGDHFVVTTNMTGIAAFFRLKP
jgi:hypothetical protein